MFSLLEESDEIAKAQRKLEKTLRGNFPRRAFKNIGYPGGTIFDANVFNDGEYWFWSANYNASDVPNPRRLNWFGLFHEAGGLQISVEINTTYAGRNDRIAGFFARDNSTGLIYLMHSGRVGGGTQGVGQSAFLAWSNQHLIDVADTSGDIREGVLVMPIEGLVAKRSAISYINKIVRFKRAVRDGELNTTEFQHKKQQLEDYYAEARGKRKGSRSSKIDYISRHGEVVDALYEWRKSKPMPQSGRLVKNILIDLGVAVEENVVEIYEVKSSATRTDIYSAIGQLLVHGVVGDCRRVMVIPYTETISDDLSNALRRLRIELLRFVLDDEKATIIER
ncbi:MULTISPECIES: hypothetical protein [unclassified Serratia (in: enterobacteria)]|uniref:hypothetical protein n=1 Tax=unclassified Serratia (in: enterobacteria) TaxID=2647522 RepID=UPI00307610FB